nr:hypothetical protein [Tanacetum cinerariifolium]
MVQTRNHPDTRSGANDPIATQLAAIAAKLKTMESLKEDISDLKRQAATKQRFGGGDSRYDEEVESSHSNHNRQPFHKIKFLIFSGGDPRGTFKVLEAKEENGEQQEIETSSLDIDSDETARISLHAMLGKPHPTTMKVHGKLNSTKSRFGVGDTMVSHFEYGPSKLEGLVHDFYNRRDTIQTARSALWPSKVIEFSTFSH